MTDTPLSPPKNVVFDIGNVVLRWDPPNLYRRVFNGDEEKVDYFLTHICTPEWNTEQDRGRSWKDGTELLVREYPEWEAPIRAYYDHWWDMLTGPIPETAPLVDELADNGIPVYAVTNFTAHAFHDCQKKWAFLNRFLGVVISSDEKLVKPDPAIFQVFLTRYHLAAKDCLFIDDTRPNIDTAAKLGMATIHNVPGETDLRLALRTLGYPV
ncbi:MAG: HAD family phosphatase [Methylobacteriaceae bacterium]|jgi:2-haloacid dehalogenase|nr:HAD family phosphatase [Methylobacteriaceae bacterium]